MTPQVETNIPTLQAPAYVPMRSIPANFATHIQPEMVRAKAGCRKCHGRGHTGHLASSTYNPILGKRVAAGAAIPCACLMVDVNALQAAVDGKSEVKP